MLRIEYVFTILFLAMGPLRAIPLFHELTEGKDWTYRFRVALFAILIAGALIALVVLTGVSTVQSWEVSEAALKIAIGLLLIRSTFATLTMLNPANLTPADTASSPRKEVSAATLAFSPLAAPTIVTPTGVVTIVLFLFLARSNAALEHEIYLVLAAMLLLNFLCMLAAEFIMRFVRLTILAVIGWMFAALQAALAVEVILSGLRSAGLAPR